MGMRGTGRSVGWWVVELCTHETAEDLAKGWIGVRRERGWWGDRKGTGAWDAKCLALGSR